MQTMPLSTLQVFYTWTLDKNLDPAPGSWTWTSMIYMDLDLDPFI